MSDQPTKRRLSPFIVWPVWLWLAVVLYLGSFGPFVWLWETSRVTQETAAGIYSTVYFPIFWIAKNTSFYEDYAVGRVYRRYIEFWIPEPSRTDSM